jgi:hypothetical protein
MTNRIHIVIAFVLAGLFLHPSDAAAFGRKVHARITGLAFDRLTVDFRARLGTVDTAQAKQWMSDGTENEDDFPRPISHFFDPVHQAKLTIGYYPVCFGIPGTTRADWWALEPTLQGISNGSDIVDAREHYKSAVLGPNPGTRNSAQKMLFGTLGHVIHLIQDMAQPEHTRNDQHLTFSNRFLRNGYQPSIWETWSDANLASAPPSQFSGYPTPSFATFGAYFTTNQRTADDRSVGRGLADFSNRSFVTQDTNYGDYSPRTACEIFPEPRITDAIPWATTGTYQVILSDGSRVNKTVTEDVYSLQLLDSNVSVSLVDRFHTHVSSIDIETRRYVAGARFYSLSDKSYQSRADFLMPRAVGYSAGIIQRFFSGKLDASWTKNATTGKWDVKITNLGTERIGADAKIKAIYIADPSYFGRGNQDDTARILDDSISTLVPGFAGISAFGGTVDIKGISVPFLQGSDPVTKFERRMIIEGTLGSEAGRVVSLVQGRIVTSKQSYQLDCWSGGRCKLWDGSQRSLDFEEVPITGTTWTRECMFTDTLPADATITGLKVFLQEAFIGNNFTNTEPMAAKINATQSNCCYSVPAVIVGTDHLCDANFTGAEFNFPNPAAVQYVKGGANKLTLIGVGSTPGTMMLLISAHVDVTYERPVP